ncbi:MAG: hypothetical protein JEZ00_15045 [Anaerolineaceae bacterium]|nr:hypothetical protein [Anaerolineaceae bacterium]
MKRLFLFVLIGSMMLASCDAMNVPTSMNEPELPVVEQATQEDSTNEAVPPIEQATEIPNEEPMHSTDPVEVTFESSDGVMLNGMYYPPREKGAPIVVLMHQFNLNMHQWDAIALWLQNAEEKQAQTLNQMIAYRPGATELAQGEPWQDASWFPALPEDFSVGVFTFTFRGCEQGCQEMFRDGWIVDAQIAAQKAASMPEVDGTRIVTVGTSIGADAVVDSCQLLAPLSSLRCVGAMSLSPGSYLGMDYTTTAKSVVELGIPVHCFASEGDAASAATCNSFEMEGYAADVDSGSDHGINMVNPDHDTNILEVLRDFLLSEVLS